MNAEEVWDALNALGNSAEEVAESLGKLGIKGTLGDADTCPVAYYLKSKGLKDAFVTSNMVREGTSAGFSDLRVDIPLSVQFFIEHFDDGAWPEMVLEDEVDADSRAADASWNEE